MLNHEPSVVYRFTSRSRALLINKRKQPNLWKYKYFPDIHHFLTIASFNQPMLLTCGRSEHFGRCKLSVWTTPCYSHDHKHNESCNAATCIDVDNGVRINNFTANMSCTTGSHTVSRNMIRTRDAKVSGCAHP